VALAGIWQELLQVERVGRQDNFFELGGHSLLAIRAVTHMTQRYGIDISLHELFATPTIERTADLIFKRTIEQFSTSDVDRISAMLTTLSNEQLRQLAETNTSRSV
jgi:aryl carrier-like protein